ncbi:MAG TPA: carboxylating nicotinate-nucleotide diphosphorylase [Pyrinomonadaceae bacterium]|jgi:nicotinate-nucleotide pyrophosphorylase (carboxylating)|nr:carboxylating nicotinate-nucleotide diphosphorylase [Pyrinomonadaceae bacterium]
MNWIDEGALYAQIGIYLREDLGRGDITTQSIIARNTRARARFVAGENMIVAGLEAAEEVFLTLDSQQQLEAFVSDGETVEAGKVIARMVGFADVLISAERVALNLMQRLSGIATLTNKYVKAVEGTGAQIADTRATTPGLRQLERFAVELGGGYNSRFGLDDGVIITANHVSILGSVASAVKTAKEKLGYLHKIAVEVSAENEVREAINAGADVIVIDGLDSAEFGRLVAVARELSSLIGIECAGRITPENVREYADAGAQLIRVEALTKAATSADISFKVQPF